MCHSVVGAAEALSERESIGGHGLVSCGALSGSDNQHVVGGACVKARWWGEHGVHIGNNVSRASRSAIFTRLGVVVQRQGGGCGNNAGGRGDNSHVVELGATCMGIGRHNKSGQGEKEDTVTTAVEMLLRKGAGGEQCNNKRGGAMQGVFVATEDDVDNWWDLPPTPTTNATATDMVINFDEEDSG